jgi:hypothetical protein
MAMPVLSTGICYPASPRLRQRRKHLHAEPLNPEPDQLDPRSILAPVVPEPVHRKDVLLDLPGANPRKIHDHVIFAVELHRERSVRRDLGQAVLLVDVVDDRLGRFVEERDQERDQAAKVVELPGDCPSGPIRVA